MINAATNEGATQAVPAMLLDIAKALRDLDDLVRLLGKRLSRAKPWQRQLATQLSELDRLLQILRMTVVIGRPDSEIIAAAETLCTACRKSAASVAGSRCDLDTQAAVRLAVDLASGVRDELRRFDSAHARQLRQAL